MPKQQPKNSISPHLFLAASLGLLAVGCGEKTIIQEFHVKDYEVSWSNSSDTLESDIETQFESGEEQLVIQIEEIRQLGNIKARKIILWKAHFDGGGIVLDSELGTAQADDGRVRNDSYEAYLPISSLEIGGMTLDTPEGMWLAGEFGDSGIRTGEFSFDAPFEGSVLDAIIDAVLQATIDAFVDSITGTSGPDSLPIDVSGISFKIAHTATLSEGEE